ncbi:ABC transporter ATP-binding protein [Tsukamurella sp. 8F]|uniref:ABC transporter ATP-binding protein n=1 Tax=unclassified Tsukamurella TaxID=2633480 RepID=UPI0023B931A5|nr:MULTISPECIES: ABC transporter ATP-binding protein [unclassified Tsukamurella]MDF0531181.1 ABC transporter ATP-binding protein [Tsukamurella sp. 8J]MDF0585872.1 ABC transporter ATP-binding protein [Tsukamurella sp. 8F]
MGSGRIRLPVLFEPSEHPPLRRPIAVDAETTPRQLVLRTMFGNPRRTVPAAILVVGHQVGEALVPVVMGLAIDRGVGTGDLAATLRWIVVLGCVFAMLSLSFRFGSRIGFLGMQTIQHGLRNQVTDRILDPRGMAGAGRSPGVALSIATSDVTRLAITVAAVVYPIGELGAVLFCGVVLLWISWPLGVVVLLGAPAILWCLDRAGGPLRRRSEHEQKAAGEAAGAAADLVAGFRVIKGIHAEPEADRRYAVASERALRAVITARRAQGAYLGVMDSVAALFVVTVGIAAGVMTVTGTLTVGQLITVVGLTQFVMGPLSALGTNFGRIWVAGLASAKRVLMILQAPYAREAGTVDVGPTTDVLELDAVPLPGGELTVTLPRRGVTAVVADAETTAALAAVLARSKSVESGSVRVGGQDVFEFDDATAIRVLRVAPHSADLFEGSVAENIAAGIGEAADAESRVTRAAFAAACDDVAEVLPHGLDTEVGEAGRLLSGGQRQRIGLARALAADSAVLVLVDPTNAVDSVTETTIAERLRAARGDAATVVFTHSPTLIAHADAVLTIDEDMSATLAGQAVAS